jgi:enamine deaminase RidA (YjgF/YER057c/UK114 family)
VGRVVDRLAALDVGLPPRVPSPPDHAAFVRSGDLVFLSGHGPLDAERRPLYRGRLGAELSESDGYGAARLSALNVLATLQAELGDLDRIRRVVRVTGYVACTPEFERHPWVINGASELLAAAFEGCGQHARTTVGVAALPLGMPCALECTFEVE